MPKQKNTSGKIAREYLSMALERLMLGLVAALPGAAAAGAALGLLSSSARGGSGGAVGTELNAMLEEEECWWGLSPIVPA